MSAAVVAQIDDQAVAALFLEFPDQAFDVLGRARVVLVAVAERTVVAVETWHLDYADRPVPAVPRNPDDLALGRLFLQLDLVADEGDDLLLGPGQGACRHDLQAHGRIGRASNQLHHVVEPPADDVHHLAVVTLCHGGNLVFRLQRAVDRGGTAGDDVDHHDVVVFDLQ